MRYVGTAFALAVALSACSDPSTEDATERDESGEIVEAGKTGVFRLQVGDCVVIPEDFVAQATSNQLEIVDREMSSVDAVPCSALHNGEVVLRDTAAFDDVSDSFPGQDELFELAGTPSASGVPNSEGLCIDALDAYTGTDYESSQYDFIAFVPTEDSWTMSDDRGLSCIGMTFDSAFVEVLSTTGSIAAG